MYLGSLCHVMYMLYERYDRTTLHLHVFIFWLSFHLHVFISISRVRWTDDEEVEGNCSKVGKSGRHPLPFKKNCSPSKSDGRWAGSLAVSLFKRTLSPSIMILNLIGIDGPLASKSWYDETHYQSLPAAWLRCCRPDTCYREYCNLLFSSILALCHSASIFEN
jgi:hypothetical protein